MRRRVRVYEWASSLVELAGVGTTAYGLAKVYEPLGWIVGGLFLTLVGFSLSPKPGEKR